MLSRHIIAICAGLVFLSGCTPEQPPLSAAEIRNLIGKDGLKAGHPIRDEIIEITPDGEITRAIGGSRGAWRKVPSFRWRLDGDKFCVDRGEGDNCMTIYAQRRYGYDELRWVRRDGSTDGVWIIIK